jgi:hypothetical protein
MEDREGFFKTIFLVGAAYDMVLGALFFFAWRPIFNALGIQPPENTSYLHITAAYVFVQGLGYWFVYRDVRRNLDLVRLGIVYKAIYVGLAAYYFAIGELLHAVFAWFALADIVFLALFVMCIRWMGATTEGSHASVQPLGR